MNRLFLSSLAALGLHGIFFMATFSGPAIDTPRPLSFQKISVSLAERQQPVFPEKKIIPVVDEKREKKITKKTEDLQPEPIVETIQPIIKKEILPKTIKEQVIESPPEKQTKISHQTESLLEKISKKEEYPVEETKKEQQHSTSAARIQEAVSLQHVNVPPAYPRTARRRGLEGLVEINALVDVEGKVKEQMLAQSSGYSILDRAALKAVRKWKFSPGIQNGRAIEMWVKVPVRFQLIEK